MENNNKQPKPESQPGSVQTFLPFESIREDTVILNNGQMRSVVLVRGTNFGLRSQAEQMGIIESFERFINSLEFPIQILCRSKMLDLSNYLESLKKIAEKQENILIFDQTIDYIRFIEDELIPNYSVMSKEFYISIPYEPSVSESGGFMSIFSGLSSKKQQSSSILTEKTFQTGKKILEERAGFIKSQLENIGLKVAHLKTDDLIVLLYNSYNPVTAYEEKINELSSLSIDSQFIERK